MTTEKNIGVLHGDCRDLVPTLPKMPFQRVSGLWLKDRKLPEGRYQQLGLGPVTLEQSTRRPTFPQEQHRRREDVRGGGLMCSGRQHPIGRLRNRLPHAHARECSIQQFGASVHNFFFTTFQTARPRRFIIYACGTERLLYILNSIHYNPCMEKKRKKPKPLIDQIRQAIDDSGQTRYRIAKETGISESALSQFYNGHRGLSMDAINTLGEHLNLRIVMDRKPKKGK